MSQATTNDQRVWSRFSVDVPTWVELSEGGLFEARCLDFSSHGVKLRSPTPMQIGQLATLSIQATQPGVTDFQADIRVQRCEGIEGQWEIGAHVLDIR